MSDGTITQDVYDRAQKALAKGGYPPDVIQACKNVVAKWESTVSQGVSGALNKSYGEGDIGAGAYDPHGPAENLPPKPAKKPLTGIEKASGVNENMKDAMTLGLSRGSNEPWLLGGGSSMGPTSIPAPYEGMPEDSPSAQLQTDTQRETSNARMNQILEDLPVGYTIAGQGLGMLANPLNMIGGDVIGASRVARAVKAAKTGGKIGGTVARRTATSAVENASLGGADVAAREGIDAAQTGEIDPLGSIGRIGMGMGGGAVLGGAGHLAGEGALGLVKGIHSRIPTLKRGQAVEPPLKVGPERPDFLTSDVPGTEPIPLGQPYQAPDARLGKTTFRSGYKPGERIGQLESEAQAAGRPSALANEAMNMAPEVNRAGVQEHASATQRWSAEENELIRAHGNQTVQPFNATWDAMQEHANRVDANGRPNPDVDPKPISDIVNQLVDVQAHPVNRLNDQGQPVNDVLALAQEKDRVRAARSAQKVVNRDIPEGEQPPPVEKVGGVPPSAKDFDATSGEATAAGTPKPAISPLEMEKTSPGPALEQAAENITPTLRSPYQPEGWKNVLSYDEAIRAGIDVRPQLKALARDADKSTRGMYEPGNPLFDKDMFLFTVSPRQMTLAQYFNTLSHGFKGVQGNQTVDRGVTKLSRSIRADLENFQAPRFLKNPRTVGEYEPPAEGEPTPRVGEPYKADLIDPTTLESRPIKGAAAARHLIDDERAALDNSLYDVGITGEPKLRMEPDVKQTIANKLMGIGEQGKKALPYASEGVKDLAARQAKRGRPGLQEGVQRIEPLLAIEDLKDRSRMRLSVPVNPSAPGAGRFGTAGEGAIDLRLDPMLSTLASPMPIESGLPSRGMPLLQLRGPGKGLPGAVAGHKREPTITPEEHAALFQLWQATGNQ
jgi:hypothetical protein